MNEDKMRYALAKQLPNALSVGELIITTSYGELELHGAAAEKAINAITKVLREELAGKADKSH